MRHVLLALTNAVKGEDAEFERWYDNVHMPEILAISGFVSARRFRVIDEAAPGAMPNWRYFALYEIEAESPEAALQEMQRRATSGEMTLSAAFDFQSALMIAGAEVATRPHD
jgi:hypothetical protein